MYDMKAMLKYGWLVFAFIMFASCSAHIKRPKPPKHPKAPHARVHTGAKGVNSHAPGQIKKVTGSKSARPYAPGQLKKGPVKPNHRK